ncbi:MAG: ABC transporter substrate-binding protein, partial [Planctomycetota bacterium]
VFPDQQPDQPGTLRIPNTLAIIKDAPHPSAAAKLVDYLMQAKTEERLAMGNSSQLPIFADVKYRPRVMPDHPVRWMKTDFESAADRWDDLVPRLKRIFDLQ